MIFSSTKYNITLGILASTLLISTQPSLASEAKIFPVKKSDGHYDYYRLKPAHHDLGYNAVVEERLAKARLRRDLPSSYKIPAAMLPPVRDQGERGTCAYFATLGLLESYYMAKSPANKNLNLSEECLTDVRNWMFDQKDYTAADKPAQRPDPEGDDPSSIVMTIVKNGVPEAQNYTSLFDCRYTDDDAHKSISLPNYLATFTTTNSSASLSYGKDINFDQVVAPSFDAIKALLANNIPVEIGVTVYNEDFNSYDWDFDSMHDRDENLAGEHAIILTGYSGSHFIFKNSWGESWGYHGYGTIEQRLIKHGWGYDKTLDFVLNVHY